MHPAALAAEYPYLIELVVELGKAGYDFAVEFEVGLDLLLDAIDRLRPEWRSETADGAPRARSEPPSGPAGPAGTIGRRVHRGQVANDRRP